MRHTPSHAPLDRCRDGWKRSSASTRPRAMPSTRRWQRFNSGINWYFNGHRLKVSVMHRESFNDRGAGDQRSRATYLQTQFSF
jgi:hypothetical protein